MDLDLARRSFRAFGRRDWDQAASILHPEIVWHDPPQLPGGGTHRGPDEVRQAWHEAFEETFEEYRIEPQEFIPAGDVMFVHTVVTGRSRHEGIEVSMDLFQVSTIRDGLIIELRSYLEREAALQGAGLDPES